jgi:predicted small lipoprotein YifL
VAPSHPLHLEPGASVSVDALLAHPAGSSPGPLPLPPAERVAVVATGTPVKVV